MTENFLRRLPSKFEKQRNKEKEKKISQLLWERRSCLNNGTNTLVIEDRAAWMEDALCPDHICVDMGKIRYSGQSIVCLPNRVVVSIEGVSGEADLYIG